MKGNLAVVKKGERFYSVVPGKKPEVREVAADYFTDAIHTEVDRLNTSVERRMKGRKR